MAVRFLVLVLLAVAEYSLGATTALAARHPGAPRPLRATTSGAVTASENAWLIGVAPIIVGDQLRFSGTDVLGREQVAVRVNSDDNKSAWSLTAHSLFAPTQPDPRATSPGGRLRVFTSNRSGLEAIYVVGAHAPDSNARRVATLARNPAWLDASTLLFESTRPGRSGIYALAVNEATPTPRLFFEKSGEVAVAPDGHSICIAARDARGQNTQLYLLAADGSGARAIAGTRDARRPCFSASGDEIYFDAPAPRSENRASASPTLRVIWMLPLLKTPPAALLTEVRPADDGAMAIYGTAFSEAGGMLKVQLAISRVADGDDAERKWTTLETLPPPIHNGVLAQWKPTFPDQKASYELRLGVTDADGDLAESALNFTWPPAHLTAEQAIAPPLFATQPERYGLEKAAPLAVPAPTSVAVSPPPVVPSRSLLPLPAPPVPRSAHVASAPRIAPTIRPATETPVRVVNRVPIVRAAHPPLSRPLKSRPTKAPPVKSPPVQKTPRKAQAQPNSGGIPSQMKANSSVPVTVVLRNTGSRSWSSTGESPVRLVYRWVDVRTNTRHYWAVKWLSETVPPGGSTHLKFDLKAPTRAGNFVLTYALVRLDVRTYDGKKYLPPPARSEDQRWPGEFGAVSFDVEVMP